MTKDRRTLTIDSDVYEKFKLLCNKNNFKISKHAEKVLLQYIEKLEKKNG